MQFGGGRNLLSDKSYSFSNLVFASFAGYSFISLIKMLGMSTYTIFQRFRAENFETPEDDFYKQLMNQLGFSSDITGTTDDEDDPVERAQNNRLNYVENILPFVLIGLFYVGTRPKFNCALWHFRIFPLSRILHTIAYQVPSPPNQFEQSYR